MGVNPCKTVFVYFKRNVVDSAKYLGNTSVSRPSVTNYCCKRAIGLNWGINTINVSLYFGFSPKVVRAKQASPNEIREYLKEDEYLIASSSTASTQDLLIILLVSSKPFLEKY